MQTDNNGSAKKKSYKENFMLLKKKIMKQNSTKLKIDTRYSVWNLRL